jgi:NAD(P)-dependent dehydrogenase (short-subunit alcohol dehydrogenase family)
MKVAVFGGGGGMGQPLVEELRKEHEVVAPRSWEINLRFPEEIEKFFKGQEFQIVIDLAVHNIDATAHRTECHQVDHQIEVNSTGFLSIARAALPYMRATKFGRIIYVSSILANRPIVGTAIYSATKSFSESLVRSIALENAKYGVTCNSVQLGYCEFGIIERVPEELLPKIIDRIPLKRLGTADELNSTINYIINTEYLTGTSIQLAGGLQIA